jgi:flavin reductase (DIM6/NTAB) family NADH-FMN oxidoreductase RutF
MFYDTTRNDHGLPQDPFKAIVAPRPVAWISTLAPTGVANLAPYSFFNAFAEQPTYIAFGSGGRKHTLSNIEASGEFAVNLATQDLREAMNASSARAAADVSEFDLAGLAPAPCRLIKPPRVAESPVTLECRHFQTLGLPNDEGQVDDFLVVGRVIGIHIADRYVVEGRVNTAAMGLIARLGYSEYTTITQTWRMRRPD